MDNIQSWLRHLCVLHLKDVHSTTLYHNASERHCAQRSKQQRRPQSARQQKRSLLELTKHPYMQDTMNGYFFDLSKILISLSGSYLKEHLSLHPSSVPVDLGGLANYSKETHWLETRTLIRLSTIEFSFYST